MDTTHLRVERLSEDDAPFDPGFSDDDAGRLLEAAPFRDMSLPADKLRRLLHNHTRLRRFKPGELVVRAGDYGSSAFLILSGAVRVVLSPELPATLLGRRESRQRSVWRTIAQLWSSSPEAEFRRPETVGQLAGAVSEDGEVRIFLQDIPRILDRHRTATIGEGEFFGEIAALSRMPRTASIFADSSAELLEVRWQGLRSLLSDPKFQLRIDDLYRKNVLSAALRAIPLFSHLTDAQREVLQQRIEFGTFGSYGWSGEYKRLAQKGAANPELEQLIAGQNTAAAGIHIVRSGFARLTRTFGAGQRTLNYVGAGQIFGLREVFQNWQTATQDPAAEPLLYQGSLRALGYTHTLFVPRDVLVELVLPTLPRAQWPEPFAARELAADDEDPAQTRVGPGRGLGPELMEFLTGNRFFNGTAAMVINLDRCTRCDDCVRACAATHGNNPRFLRHGPTSGRIQVAQACMHCVDPVCMIGCPTGAIHRDAVQGHVVINQATCVGCSTCSNQCPYEAIRMVEVRNERGVLVTDPSLKPILKATKCDLCQDQYGGPACERACPHDALKRVDLTTLTAFERWVNK